MRKRILIIIASCLAVGLLLFPLFANYFIIRPNIFYIFNYNTPFENREDLITKVENLNYTSLLNDYFELEEYKSYIDYDLLQQLKQSIENDSNFHWELSYHHFLKYHFTATNHSKLYLTYNNETMYSLKDENNESLILRDITLDWNEFAWFLNYTYLPSVSNDYITLLMSDKFFIMLRLEYNYYYSDLCSYIYFIQQFLIIDADLNILMIFIPYPWNDLLCY